MGHDAFNDDLVKVVLPYVDTHYRTVADRDHRAIAGLSMGGLQALNIALDDSADFAYVGMFSSGWFPNSIKGRRAGAHGCGAVPRIGQAVSAVLGGCGQIRYRASELPCDGCDPERCRNQCGGTREWRLPRLAQLERLSASIRGAGLSVAKGPVVCSDSFGEEE